MKNEATSLGWYIKVINNLLRARMNEQFKDEDLTKVQFEVLLYLDTCSQKREKVIQRDLENHFHISNPSVSNMISRLEGKGLIERVSDGDDRRKRYVVLTAKARQVLDETHQSLQQFYAQILEGITQEELEAGLHFLQRILSNLNGREDLEFDFYTCKTDQAV